MLQVTQSGFFKPNYEIYADNAFVTRYETTVWSAGGTFRLADRGYAARCSIMANRWELTSGDEVVARAGSLLRRQWTIDAGAHSYGFQRAGAFRREFEYLRDGSVVGFIRRASLWRNDIEAELPGLPLVLQVFLVGICVVAWRPKG